MERVTGEGPSDRHRPRHRLRQLVGTGGDRRLGRPVPVQQSHPRMGGAQLAGESRREDVADGGGQAQSSEVGKSGADQLVQHPSREAEVGDPPLGDQGPEFTRVGAASRRDHEPGTVQQRPPDLQPGDVELERHHVEDDVIGAGQDVRPRAQHVDEVAVGHLHPLWNAGRAGGEENVGEAAASGGDRHAVADRVSERLEVESRQLRGQAVIVAGATQRPPRPRQLEQRPLTFGRIARADRDVGGARPGDAQKGADRLPGPRQADTDRLFRLDAVLEQSRGDRRAGSVELGVGKPRLAVLDRDRLGTFAGTLGDHSGKREIQRRDGRWRGQRQAGADARGFRRSRRTG